MLLHLKRTEWPGKLHRSTCYSVTHNVRHILRLIVFRRCSLSQHLKCVQLSLLQKDYFTAANDGTVNAYAASAMMNSFSRVMVMLFSSLCCISASAENLYVRSGASGNGSSWANAWGGFNNIVWGSGAGQAGAGDTIWVAGGAYSPFTVGSDGVTIKRARSTNSECASAAGWNSSYDSQVTMDVSFPVLNGIWVEKNNVTIDGQVWEGIKIYVSASPTPGAAISHGIKSLGNYNTFRYIRVTGPGNVPTASEGISSGWTYAPPWFTNLTIQYCEIDRLLTLVQLMFTHYTIIEHCKFHDSGPGSMAMHDNVVYVQKSDHCEFRYNESYSYSAEGLYFGTMCYSINDWKIHGNVFRDTYGSGRAIDWHSIALVGCNASQFGPDWYIYNNTFVNMTNYMTIVSAMSDYGWPMISGGRVFNNIFYNCGYSSYLMLTNGYNWYGGGGQSAGGQGGTNDVINGSNPFINLSGKNFRLSGPTAAGKPLGPPYNIDPDKKTRGADGVWDRGAYEYGSGDGPTNAMISVSPNALDFGSIMIGTTNNLTFMVQNFGSGTLVGTSSVPSSAFSTTSGQVYSLTNGQSSVVTVQFSPKVAGATNQTVTFTGGGDATALVSGVAVLPPVPGSLTFEAEAGSPTAPFIIAGGYIYQTSETSVTAGGRAIYNFTITNAGDYVIQALVNAPGEGANSFFVNIDAEPQEPYMTWQIPVTTGFERLIVNWQGNGTWDNPEFGRKVFNLTAGSHQLIIRGREANTQLDHLGLVKLVSPPRNLAWVLAP